MTFQTFSSIVVPKTQAFADCVPENLWTHVYVKRGKAIFYAIPFRSPNERENGGEREDCHVEFRAKNGVERSEFHACLSLECFPSLSWLREQCRVNTDKCRASNEEMLVYEQSRGRGVRSRKSLRSWLLFIIFLLSQRSLAHFKRHERKSRIAWEVKKLWLDLAFNGRWSGELGMRRL